MEMHRYSSPMVRFTLKGEEPTVSAVEGMAVIEVMVMKGMEVMVMVMVMENDKGIGEEIVE